MGLFGRLLGTDRGNNTSQSYQPNNNSALSTCGPQGCPPASDVRSAIRSSVVPQSLQPTTTVAGSPTTTKPSAINSSVTPAATGTTTSTASLTQDTAGVVTLENGVRALIKDGQIRATVDLSAAQAAGQVESAYQGGPASGNRQLKSNDNLQTLVKSEVGGLTIEKSRRADGTQFANVYAAKDLDTVTLKFIDANGAEKNLTISRADILRQEKAALEAKAKAASTPAEKPVSPPAAAATTPAPAASPAETTTAKPATTPTVPLTASAPDTTTPAPAPKSTESVEASPKSEAAVEYDPSVSGAAKELESILGITTGIFSNTPSDPNFESKLDKLLAVHPTVQDRARLVETIGTAKLGELLHEVIAFDKVFDKIGAPLNTDEKPTGLQSLKAAVELLNDEYHKYVEGYDNGKINQAFKAIESLPAGAESLAAVYWSKIRNDGAYLGAETFETMRSALKEAVATKPEAEQAATETNTPNTEYNPELAGYASELRSVLTSEVSWNPFYNQAKDSNYMEKTSAILAKFPTAAERSKLILGVGAKELGELLHELPDSDRVIDKFLEPLQNPGGAMTGAAKLKDSVEALREEYAKSGNLFASDFDKQRIKAAFDALSSLGEGAQPLAEMYWYKRANDDAYFSSSTFEDMKATLEAVLTVE